MDEALQNGIILRTIFKYLDFDNLKKFRLVNETWNFEAGSFMRDFYRSNATISAKWSCSDLKTLDEIATGTNAIVPINSLTIILGSSSFTHTDCPVSESGLHQWNYNELMDKIPLKYLTVSWEEKSSLVPRDCPAVEFVVNLIRRKAMELRALKLDVPDHFPNYFPDDWTPCFPKLTELDLNMTRQLIHKKDFILKILQSSPALKTLKTEDLDAEVLEVIPQDRYALLNSLTVAVSSKKEGEKYLQLAHTGIALSSLRLISAGRPEHRETFTRISDQLLANSCKTLQTLCLDYSDLDFGHEICPLNLHTCPPLVHVRKLDILSEFSGCFLMKMLQTINFATQFPALAEVILDEGCLHVHGRTPAAAFGAIASGGVHRSATVTTLRLFTVEVLNCNGLKQLFPNVRTLELREGKRDKSFPYQKIWSSWGHLESLLVTQNVGALRANFDWEFMGNS